MTTDNTVVSHIYVPLRAQAPPTFSVKVLAQVWDTTGTTQDA